MDKSQPINIETIQLGKSDVRIPLMGTGCWQWGERKFWEYGSTYQKEDIYEAFRASIEAGILFFDTSEGYGQGESERLLGGITHKNCQRIIVATKYDPKPWRRWKRSVIYAGQQSLKRLRLQKVDLYQIHWPTPPLSIEKMAEALVELVESGRTRAVGVSNYNEEQMHRTYETLSKHGIPLASNQVRYSLYHREVEKNGVMKACKELGVTLIAYSPIAQGLLSGKYSPENLPTGRRRSYYGSALLAELQPLIKVLKEIGQSNGGKTPAQVALNWLLCKGVLPIPGAKNGRQVKENAGALGWRLSTHEVEVLDEISSKY
jgi:aryl-alcohol dehydrogenase-like predicted oxidoreductase